MASETVSAARCFGGEQRVLRHRSAETGTEMRFAAFLPPQALAGARVPGILVDQGMADGFLANQLKPELLEEACGKAGIPLTLRRQEGYDHSYFFIATFIEDHLRWHAARLGVA